MKFGQNGIGSLDFSLMCIPSLGNSEKTFSLLEIKQEV